MGHGVRYVPGGDNSVLRHVLGEVWNLHCYWCRQPKKYLELQIDHVVPKTNSDAERKRLQAAFNLNTGYDVHAVENLAPICGPCNIGKSNADMTQYPVVLTFLKKARKLAPRVVRGVQAFSAPADLGGALLLAAQADLDDPDVRSAFEVGAPAIVQRLSELGEGKADYVVYREVTVETLDENHTFFVCLDELGRAAIGVFEQIARGVLAEALLAPIDDLFERTREAVANAFRDHDEGMGAPDVGSVSVDWPTLSIDAVRYSAGSSAQLQFEFQGSFEGLATGAVARDSEDGSGLEDVQGDATFTCRFKFDLTWEPDDGADEFFFDQVWLEDFNADTTVDGKSSHQGWDWPDDYEPDEDESA